MKKLLLLIVLPLFAPACGDVFEADISADRVSVIAPSDGTQVVEGNIAFHWDLLDGAEKYRVTVVSPRFGDAAIAVRDTIVSPDSLARSFLLRLRLTEASYQWSIQAFNHAYQSRRSVYDLNVTKKEVESETGEQ